ncbi:MAG: hypothetical protein KDC98_21550 [Planctomycetes bacterium]|nr:hypothetical protein [Planctomycetota bacterium]
MNQKPLLLVPVALLCGAGLWLAIAGNGEPILPAPAPTTGTVAPTTDIDPVVDSGAGTVTAHEASGSLPAEDKTRDAVSTYEPLLPIPEDASWTEVRIVDKASGEPVPGAVVFWHDNTTSKAMREGNLVEDGDYSITTDPEQLGARFGWHTTSDADGIARIHRDKGTEMVARHGNRYGHRSLGEELVPPRDGFRLELEPDFGFDVRVVDASDEPVARIPVAIATLNAKGERERMFRWQPLATTRAPDGLARIAHTQQLEEFVTAGNKPNIRVIAHLPGLEDEGVPLDLDALPTEPLVLHLPATGSVRARAVMNGQPVEVESISLQEHRRSGSFFFNAPRMSRRPDADGWARFESVPLGKKMSVSTRLHGGWISEQVDGPIAPDVEVTVELSPAEGEIMLAGRLLDSDRSPLGNQEFTLRTEGEFRHNSTLETAADGRFLAMVGKIRDKSQASSITVAVQREGEQPLIAEVPGRKLRAGTEDLGDFVLRLDALVVAGHCSVDGVAAKLPEQSRIQYLEPREGREPRWRNTRKLRLHATDDGTFEFRGTAEPGQLRLAINGRDHRPLEPIEFTPGTENLPVELSRGCTLAATMLVPDGTPQDLTAELIPSATAGGVKPGDEIDDNSKGRVSMRPDGRQQADWSGLAPGSYDLLLSINAITEPVYRITGVELPLPPDGDPRLVDIDLRERLRVQEITLLDDSGKPARGARGCLFPEGQAPNGDQLGFPCWGGKLDLLLPAGPMTLLAGIPGFRPFEIACSGDPVEVRLEPWPKATVLITTTVPLPEGCTLYVSLQRAKSDGRRYRSQWMSGEVAELLQPPSRQIEVKAGKAELQIGDEPRGIELKIRHQRRRVDVEIPTQQASFSTPTIRLQVPEQALKQAIEEVMKAKE